VGRKIPWVLELTIKHIYVKSAGCYYLLKTAQFHPVQLPYLGPRGLRKKRRLKPVINIREYLSNLGYYVFNVGPLLLLKIRNVRLVIGNFV
jgi:hypothetical protein